ncbi:MAG: sigma-70 family RNA polymerase sigma factor [Phycisphaerales bacterium]|nr:sigma-70 family RNA polymerase sigma factor [Phycisphaerales bacterium]
MRTKEPGTVGMQARTNQDNCRTGAAPWRSDEGHLELYWNRWHRERCTSSRTALIEHYMQRQVRPIAERLRGMLPRHVEVDDLVQQGYLGLADAMDRWDPTRGIRFETFSSRRISGAMRDWLRTQDHLPRLMRRRNRRVQQALEGFRTANGRAPDRSELQTHLEVDDQELSLLLNEVDVPAVVTFGGLESGGDEDGSVADLAQSDDPGAVHSLQREDMREFVVRGMETMDRMIVVLYYYESLTMREIGAVLGCSESRVSQRMDSIIQRLKARVDLTPERLAVA